MEPYIAPKEELIEVDEERFNELYNYINLTQLTIYTYIYIYI